MNKPTLFKKKKTRVTKYNTWVYDPIVVDNVYDIPETIC